MIEHVPSLFHPAKPGNPFTLNLFEITFLQI
jgi:hypothetical protein